LLAVKTHPTTRSEAHRPVSLSAALSPLITR
jgi:hypothetical protein